MLKFVESSVTFAEFPDEISLVFSISNCPNHCPGCSESYLAGDIGTELTFDVLEALIKKNPGITLVGFLGGDNDVGRVAAYARYIQSHYGLKVGMYSGRDFLDLTLANILDYYKIGRFIMPTGDSKCWSKKTCGPINFPFSNQIMFKREGNNLINITEKFRQNPVSSLENHIIK